MNALVAELEQEAASTRRLLERVPMDRLDWAPHAKSMKLGQLAMHIATIQGALADFISETPVELPDIRIPEPMSREHLLETFEDSVARTRARLVAWTDADFAETWTMTKDGAVLVSAPRGPMVRTLVFNHLYHHRGQLSVYLRELDVRIPGMYGPSADEL